MIIAAVRNVTWGQKVRSQKTFWEAGRRAEEYTIRLLPELLLAQESVDDQQHLKSIFKKSLKWWRKMKITVALWLPVKSELI